MKILLVEDDTMIASGLMYALEQEGYEPFHCMTASDAVHRIKTELYDLAILDMQLPDGTGFDVSRALKENSTPIIFLTVVDDESKIVSAFENGAADYVTKPFRLRELLARVKRTLQAAKGGKSHRIFKNRKCGNRSHCRKSVRGKQPCRTDGLRIPSAADFCQ